MKSYNHLAGGFLFTGIAASLSGINIFESPYSIAITAFGALIPDIDHPKSAIGRALTPISSWVNRKYGHRTITHSGLALMISTFIFALLEKMLIAQSAFSLIFFYAYSSHLVFDMMTLQGIPLLYPFYKNPFVIPGNPSFRIRTDDRKTETILFLLFLMLNLSLRPLFQNGFWTSYNRLFGTMHHLYAEFQQAKDLLSVEYFTRKGSQPFHGHGYCIDATENKATLIESDSFRVLDPKVEIIEKVIPEHTNKKYFYHVHSFENRPLDSLNKQFYNQMIAKIELKGNQPFKVIANRITSKQTYFKANLITDLWLEEIWEPIPLDTPFHFPNPRIARLQHELSTIQQKNQSLQQNWQNHLEEVNRIRQLTLQESDFALKEEYYTQYQNLLKSKPPQLDEAKEIGLAIEIQQLTHLEYLQQKEQQAKQRHPPQKQPTLVSGFITTITIE